jgi:curved DNA-binding protein CbpA
MDTLYDLLGALPQDDAEDLRAAFRKAVKGAHPDLRPDDPDAALKFRQIVRANEILGDADQRATYDHLLALARWERRWPTVHRVTAAIDTFASTVIAVAGASIVAAAAYLLFVNMSPLLFAPANSAAQTSSVEVSTHASPETATTTANAIATAIPVAAAIAAVAPSPAEDSSFLAKRESASVSTDAAAPNLTTPSVTAPRVTAPSVVVPLTTVVSVPALNIDVAADPAPNDARSFRARGISAYHYGDLNRAIADLDQAIQLDPNISATYIDRSIVLYRLGQFDRAFADIARAKRIEKESRAKSTPGNTPAMAKKPRLYQTGMGHSATPQS